MSVLADVTPWPQATTPWGATIAPAQRLVTVVVDACCELDPAAAAELGVMIMPRDATIDGKPQTLTAQRTLHYACWPQPPRRFVPAPYALGDLARAYQQVLDEGRSVLALHMPGRLDSAARVALAARSILLAGQSGAHEHTPRVAIYELATVGVGFAFLVQAAARGAAAGMTLQQVLTLLDRAHAALRSVYLTSMSGPVDLVRHPARLPGVARMGSEELWSLDRESGLFMCRARGWSLARSLFRPGGPLAGVEPNSIRSTHTRLLASINQGRAQATLQPLTAAPGGLTLAALFPKGCVELTVLPEPAHIDNMIDVIRRIDQSAANTQRGPRRVGVGVR